ncbi:hypothetical protein D3C81_906120 [compost metagenome]
MLELRQHAVYFLHLHAGAGGDAALARGLDQFRLGAFLRRHRVDDAAHAAYLFVGLVHVLAACRLLELGRQLVHQVGHAAHFLHLAQLRLEVVHVELAANLDLLRQVGRRLAVDALARLFHQGQDVAHAEDAIGHAGRVERFQAVEFFRNTGKLDRFARDVAHGQGRTAARVTVELGQHDARQRQRIIEGLGRVDGVLAQHGVDDEQGFDRFHGAVDGGDFAHHLFVDTQAARRIDDQHVVVMLFRPVQRGKGDIDRLVGAGGREEVGAHLGGDRLQLGDRGGTVDVGRDGQHFLLLFFLQVLRQLADGGGFTHTLQTGHQDDGGRLLGKADLRRFRPQVGAHQGGQLALHHAHQGLARRQRGNDILAHGFFFDFGDEFAHGGQGDVGLEQRQAHFAQHVGGVRFGQARLAAHGLDDFGKPLGEII